MLAVQGKLAGAMGQAIALGVPMGENIAAGDAQVPMVHQELADVGIVFGKLDEPAANGVAIAILKAVVQPTLIA